MNLSGKVSLVTGGTLGIGAAIVLELARRGSDVAVAARNVEGEALALKQEAEALGRRCILLAADLAREEVCGFVVAETVKGLGKLDVILHNAGGPSFGKIEDVSTEQWLHTMALHVNANFFLAKAALPHLRARGGGNIIAISSGAGKQGYAGLAAYSASKFGLMGLMQGLGAEVAPDHIKVSTIVPGSIMTPFGDRPVDDKRAAAANDPGKKYLEPEDVAEAVLYLLRQPPRAWTQELNLWPF
jgi:3-oxoacyl-[acyl-carrier protein] reductase